METYFEASSLLLTNCIFPTTKLLSILKQLLQCFMYLHKQIQSGIYDKIWCYNIHILVLQSLVLGVVASINRHVCMSELYLYILVFQTLTYFVLALFFLANYTLPLFICHFPHWYPFTTYFNSLYTYYELVSSTLFCCTFTFLFV